MPTQQSESAPSSIAKPRILIIGFGALGILYGWTLAQGGAEVVAYARSNAELIRKDGVDLKSLKYGEHLGWKPAAVASSESEAQQHGPYDYVLCTFKVVPELQSISSLVAPLISPSPSRKPLLVLVQNGIAIEHEPYEKLCLGHDAPLSGLISCCAWLGATLREGRVCEHGGLETLNIGLYPTPEAKELQQGSERVKAWEGFIEVYSAGGGGAIRSEDVQIARWRKIFWNACWGGLCFTSRQTVMSLLSDDSLEYTVPVVKNLMSECMQVARATGLGPESLPDSAMDDAFNITYPERPSNPDRQGRLAPGFKPSLLIDLEAGRPMELVPGVGNVCTLARKHGVSTPALDLVLASLRPAQVAAVKSARQERGLDAKTIEGSGGPPAGPL
ncbi:panE, apbA [Ceraceosorus bombacis]|uniref:PanE, apbA n=1 Tax=Ceraceosorus bombacis TaxID=401625 RepID=A0A0P1BRG3_9BASI|nr:panE, apbA [Ceraceosorus bombacis]